MVPGAISANTQFFFKFDDLNHYDVFRLDYLTWFVGHLHYNAKIFDIKNSLGATKYNILPKLVKSALSLQDGNAAVEKSLSDNKNTLISTAFTGRRGRKD